MDRTNYYGIIAKGTSKVLLLLPLCGGISIIKLKTLNYPEYLSLSPLLFKIFLYFDVKMYWTEYDWTCWFILGKLKK